MNRFNKKFKSLDPKEFNYDLIHALFHILVFSIKNLSDIIFNH